MANIITLESYNSIQFYQIPQAFYHNPKYYGMNSSSRETYAMLRNLLPLSINNGWINEEGEIYVKLSREKLMLRLGIGKDKMVKVFKELRELGLIIEKRVGCNKCNEIYLCEAEDLNEIYSDEELLNLLEEDENEGTEPQPSRSSAKQKSEPLKKRSQDCDKTEVKTSEKQRHNKTKNIKTESNKTKTIKQQQPKEKEEVVVVSCDAHLPEVDEELIEQYKSAFGRRPSQKARESLVSALARFDREVVLYALELAGGRGKHFDYAQGVLRKWTQHGVRTFDDVFEYEERYRNCGLE
nr:DnaD domain protein [uncultured Cellulosilyticum sp.]